MYQAKVSYTCELIKWVGVNQVAVGHQHYMGLAGSWKWLEISGMHKVLQDIMMLAAIWPYRGS